jgi:hypothetical protein
VKLVNNLKKANIDLIVKVKMYKVGKDMNFHRRLFLQLRLSRTQKWLNKGSYKTGRVAV